MNLYSSLETYVKSQKKISLYFFFLGFILLGIGAFFFFINSKDLFYQGLSAGSIGTGIITILGGIIAGILNNRILNSVKDNYKSKKDIFLKNETRRIEKRLIIFSIIQTVATILIILSIGVIISFKLPFPSGLFLAISLQCLGIISIESIFKYSINIYYEELLSAHSSTFILEDV
tara:strand:- start:2292 stop:2816 length:525 start_codon:yes stop_codon:yes gene_type:complete